MKERYKPGDTHMVEMVITWRKSDIIDKFGLQLSFDFISKLLGKPIIDKNTNLQIGTVEQIVDDEKIIQIHMLIMGEFADKVKGWEQPSENFGELSISTNEHPPIHKLVMNSHIIRKVNKEIINKYNKSDIIGKAIEEFTELMIELIHNNKGKNNITNVIEEIGDVQLMLWQLIYKYQQEDQDIRNKINSSMYYKICRVEDRLDRGEL